MILSGKAISLAREANDIIIEPYNKSQINPNSYNYRLGENIKIYTGFSDGIPIFEDYVIPSEGFVLLPGQMYLGHTYEKLGSKKYAMSLIGRSSIGRLGLFMQLSANLGHTTSIHCWTLEMFAAKPIRIYPKMIIGQISFWTNCGEVSEFISEYIATSLPTESLLKR